MSVKVKLMTLEAAAVLLSAVFVWFPLSKADFSENPSWILVYQPRHPNEPVPMQRALNVSDDTISPFNDSGGEKQIQRSECYQHESVGECEARVAQENVGILYICLAALGVVQAAVASLTWRVSAQQTKLLQRQHIATHRPRLVVRGVRMFPDMETNVEKKRYDRVARVEFVVVNSGSSKATITRGAAVARLDATDSVMRYIVLGKTTGYSDTVIEAGQAKSYVLSIDSSEEHPATWLEVSKFLDEYGFKYVLQGGFLYADDSRVLRQMAFARTLGSSGGYWVPSDSLDHEYND